MSRLSIEEQAEYDAITDPGEKRKWTLARKKRMREERIAEGKPVSKSLLPRKRTVRRVTGKKSAKAREARVEKAKAHKSVQDMRGAIAGLLESHDLDPIEELIIYCKRPATPQKEKIQLYKFLLPYLTPTLKAVDIQQDLKMNVSVELQSFDGARLSDMKTAEPVDEGDYEEFLTDDNTIEMELDKPDLTQNEEDVLLGRN